MERNESGRHEPVMVQEVLEYLGLPPRPDRGRRHARVGRTCRSDSEMYFAWGMVDRIRSGP